MAVELDELAGPGSEEGRRLAQFWKNQLDKIRDNARYKRWLKRGQTIEKRYRDERNRVDEEGQRRYSSLWSNVEILFPAIYGKTPVPIAERRFRDKDPAGRGAAQILERALRNEIEICGFDEAMQHAVKDYLLSGQGTVWVRYEPEIEEGVSLVNEGQIDMKDAQGFIKTGASDNESSTPEGEVDTSDEGPPSDDGQEENEEIETKEQEETDKLQETGDRILRESTPVDYINWEDFFMFPDNARVWREVTAVGKRVYMTRDQMVKRFGRMVGKHIPLKKDERGITKYDGPDQDPEDKGEVFEIWNIDDKTLYWIAEGYEYLCDRKDDPLNLEHFWPCPKPLFANPTTGTIVPVADFMQYQDQAIQIDELTQRISMLAKACKVAGVYNAAAKSIQRLLNESVENELIPVDDWAAFAEKGGIAGNISFIPLKEIMGVLQELMTIKDKAIMEMDRLTGINDIMRGTTDARETLGAQRLKTNNTGTRLQRRQNEVARFARDVVRIMADIMAQHFSPTSLVEASGALYEEGLGNVDTPPLTMLQGQQQPGPPPGPPVQPGQPTPSPPTSVPLLPANGPAASAPPPNAPSPPVGGGAPPSNIVPFRPNPGMPGSPPGMQMGGPGMPPLPPPPSPQEMAQMAAIKRIADALKLIRDERLRGFRVDIEVDSTIYADLAQEKNDRNEFLMMVTKFLEQAGIMSQQIPQITPLLGKFLQFGVRGFKIGRDLETAIEEFCDEAAGIAQQKAEAAKNAPNPAVITAQAADKRGQAALITAQNKSKTDQGQFALKANESQAKIAIEKQKSDSEIARQQIENQGEQQNNQADMMMKQMDLRMREMEMEIEKMRVATEAFKAQQLAMKPLVPPQDTSLGNEESA